jgi:hypothetical protein
MSSRFLWDVYSKPNYKNDNIPKGENNMELFDAMANAAQTENGMASYRSTLNACLDLFFKIGASRGRDLREDFKKAFEENPDLAGRILLWSRDVREGAGERQIFRDIISDTNFSNWITDEFIWLIPEIGRWDDLLVLLETVHKGKAAKLIAEGLNECDPLCAKWMPRKGKYARILRESFKLSPRDYRKLLVRLTNVVEQKMCNNEWKEIEYGKIPSLAFSRYKNALIRHDEEGFAEFIENVKVGKETINAGAVYPYDIVKSLIYGDNDEASDLQWQALPDWIPNDKNFIPVVDVSGSMACGYSNIRPIDVAISLGLYVSERNKGVFKDKVISFSENPNIFQFPSTDPLSKRVQALENMEWGMDTNLEKVFSLILNTATSYKIKEEEMPETIIIFSDMQFNATSIGEETAFDMIAKKYQDNGYKMPGLVFWNLDAREGCIPITYNQDGVALVSGFSPALMETVLSGEMNPVSIMTQAVMKDRYDWKYHR